MKKVALSEAKDDLSRILRQAEKEDVIITRHGKPAGDDPWDAWTLEWSTTSPPPEYNFETLPEVRSRRPLWDLKHPEDPDWKYE